MRTIINFFDTVFDQFLNLLGRPGTALRKVTHFARNYRKSSTLISSMCGFYGSVQGEQVGLESNLVNHADNVCNFAAGGINFLHRRHGFVGGLTAFFGQ